MITFSMLLDLDKFRVTPLCREPFEYLIVPEFVKRATQDAIHNDFPHITEPGSFALSGLKPGPAFARLIAEVQSEPMRHAFEEKFRLDLSSLPTVVTVRGQSGPNDGFIHTDLPGKVITVLIYLNSSWEDASGRLRLLRSPNDIEDVIVEVPPVAGTLLAFRRCGHSYHGHKPFLGERRVIQLNWVTRAHHRALRRNAWRRTVTAFFANLWRRVPA